MPQIKPIQPADSPLPAGHYSPGVSAGGLIYVSGQLPVDDEGKARPELPFAEQVRQSLLRREASGDPQRHGEQQRSDERPAQQSYATSIPSGANVRLPNRTTTS